jgi:lipopolysaccharide transport system ATP-binding protein
MGYEQSNDYSPPQPNYDQEEASQIELASTPNNHSIDAFDPGLVPETTTVYPIQGAEIDSIHIANTNGQIVNVLSPGESYQFVVSGRFLNDFSGVFFGIHMKSVSGVIVTGQRFPEDGRFYETVAAGQSFQIGFTFRMDLLPGVYFAGGGIWSSEEPSCAHRIIDALMFRVAPAKASTSFGYVDLMSAGATLKFEGAPHEN